MNYVRSIFVSVTELKPDPTYLCSCRITLLNPSCRCRIPNNILPSYVTCLVKTLQHVWYSISLENRSCHISYYTGWTEKKNIHSTSLMLQLIADFKEALFISAMNLLSGRTLITGLSYKLKTLYEDLCGRNRVLKKLVLSGRKWRQRKLHR